MGLHNKSKVKEDNRNDEKQENSFPIVGIGGSAGAFNVIEKFFLNMPSDSGMAFVVVMHLDPSNDGLESYSSRQLQCL